MNQPAEVLPSRRAKQRVDTRNRIYDAAIAEFRVVGYPNAQIDRIAKAAGVVRGTFYFHFPSKEHVLLELQSREEARLVERLATLRRKNPTVRAALSSVINGILEVEAAVADSGLMRDMLSMYVRQPVDPALAEQAFPVVRELEHHLAEAAQRGEIRSDLGPGHLTVIFLTSVFGFLVSRAESPAGRRTSLDSLVDIFLGGIAT